MALAYPSPCSGADEEAREAIDRALAVDETEAALETADLADCFHAIPMLPGR